MRRKDFVPALIFFATLLLLCSQTLATKSRLMGMGDLSIVIEDESNMINLWDFCGNPAGFLADEKGSVIRTDVSRERYKIKDLRYPGTEPGTYSKYQDDGDVLRGNVLLSFRRNGNFALGLGGDYFYRESVSKFRKSEYEYPDIFVVFSKGLSSLTCVGADIKYVEYTAETNYKETETNNRSEIKYFRTQLGLETELTPAVALATLLGYDRGDTEPYFRSSDYHTYWVSLQSIVEIESKLKLGVETSLRVRLIDLRLDNPGWENHYSTSLRLRAIYDLNHRLNLGVFYSDNELFSDRYYPIEIRAWPFSPYGFAASQVGFGASYKLAESSLVGIEYSFSTTSEPDGNYPDPGFMRSSLHLGVEAKLTPAWFVRGGYVGIETDVNPPAYSGTQVKSWENALTLGTGYQPQGWNLIVEMSYRYTFTRFEEYYRDWDVKSYRNVLSVSFKMAL
jgi:opacity protein-like surface antigen